MDKLLIYVRCDAIGDAILANGMLPALRRGFVGHKLFVLCQPGAAIVYEKSPFVDRIIPFKKVELVQNQGYRDAMFQQLRDLNADVCINTVFSRDDIGDHLVAATRAKVRIGHHGDTVNIPPKRREENNPVYSHLVSIEHPSANELQRNAEFLDVLQIAAPDLSPLVWTDERDVHFAESIFHLFGLGRKNPVIALFGGARAKERRYPHLGLALRRLADKQEMFVIGLGSTDEFAMNEAHLRACGAPYVNLSGKTDVLQMAEIIRRCTLAFGSESGIAQIACAVGTRNVIVQGGGFFGRFLPYSPLTSVVCLPLDCYGCNFRCKYATAHCVADILPEVVEAGLRDALEKPAGKLPRVFVMDSDLWKSPEGGPTWKWESDLVPTAVDVVVVKGSATGS